VSNYDNIDPPHYTGNGGLRGIDVVEQFELGFCLGNAIKYILRCGRKPTSDPIEDLKKARWHIDREIAKRERARNV
jgi:hypothetical protein